MAIFNAEKRRTPVLGLIGIGKMGQHIDRLWRDEVGGSVLSVHARSPRADWDRLASAHVLIDVSAPDAIERICQIACTSKIPWVLGTTGWETAHPTLKETVLQARIACLYAPNFSVGMHLLRKALSAIVPALAQWPNVEVSIREVHHSAKLDRPSGTAKALAEDVARSSTTHTPNIYSERRSTFHGKHEVLIDTPDESIMLLHETRDRASLARGALWAAQWLIHQPPGWYEMNDALHRDSLDMETKQHKGGAI